ncbi:ubiquitin-conjugating enzyme E2Q-like protein CG4502 [Schistocerca americana]|uniref:ubiquitin-conjugating enzyme E2Q-like protein CG4502 n=1 Tax=Schistocerca americana TaxID=7009 RepID=UPI001F4F7D51|nr:ubiquitin-conjugating enzyme E2Q-like protein CG4502 [Schistocerca americana]XP_049773778.1 ubiquitin-conjugating enzyme E2Q-like protein CG4502 [Schistocerca cancellata]XP_049802783.1 ubiquitin-conjugating enzyme E2Q-like protein CG4502 [Schistocerca nitens]XP_049947724.1 ubiquitin-conjugating enzyme E2Q-like protein CG4502 [Schistocerca serialis cubense]
MSSRSKEKMAAAFRRLFRPKLASSGAGEAAGDAASGSGSPAVAGAAASSSSSAAGAAAAGASGGGGSNSNSPVAAARRLLSRHGYHHRDAVTPAESAEARGGGGVAGAAAPVRKSALSLLRPKKSSAAAAGAGAGAAAAGHSADKGACGSQAGAIAAHKTVRARRLMKELREIQRLQAQQRHDPVFTVELVNDNLFEWHVRLFRVDAESELAGDMRELGVPCILLHLAFPDNFPFAPPFMRVISPRIEKGFVMEGGAICMELLTPRGWASAYTVEAVVMQFAASIVKGQGRIARKHKGSKDFSRRSAEESFRSLVKTHDKYGWVTPPLADG